MSTKIQIRRDTAANWASVNPTLLRGELGFETDTGRIKVGTGQSQWTALPYLTLTSQEISALLATHSERVDNPHVVTKAQVGLSNVPNTDATLRENHAGTQPASSISDFSAAVDSRISNQKGQPNGIASLDGTGLIASSYLPSYVDDVLEVSTLPASGEIGKIYITTSDSKVYRWSGSTWVEIVASPGSTDAVPEGSTNLYFTIERAQDAVASALTNTTTVNFLYDDAQNTISASVNNASITNAKITSGIDAAKIGTGVVSNTVFSYLDGVTSPIQTQFAGKESTISAGTTAQYWRGDKTWQTLNSSALTDFSTSVDSRIAAQKGQPNGLAPLDGTGLIASSYLPSYVDDVVEYATFAALPATGETGKIYITTSDNKVYRWSGSAYVQIVSSPGSTDAVPEGSTNLYFTVERAQDAVATALTNTTTVNFVYDDPNNTISASVNDSSITNSKIANGIDAAKIGTGVVSNAEYAYLDGVTSPIQTQLAGKEPTISAGTSAQYYRGDKTWQTLNTTAVPEGTNLYYTDARTAAYVTSQKGIANGIAPLDATGLIAAAYIPATFDDVLEFANLNSLPATGEAGKLYIVRATNKLYRYNTQGSTPGYVEIGSTISGVATTDNLPEGSLNLYYTDSRVATYIGTQKGVASGLASLDANAKLPIAQAPTASAGAISTTSVNSEGTSLSLARADHTHAVLITNSEATATASATTTSATDAVLTGMTVTPAAGTYLAIFSTTVSHNTTGATVSFSMYSAGSQVAASLRTIIPRPTNAANQMAVATQAIVTVNGAQAIDIRWSTSAATATANARALSLLKIG